MYHERRRRPNDEEWMVLLCSLYRIQDQCDSMTKILSKELDGHVGLFKGLKEEILEIKNVTKGGHLKTKFREFWKSLWKLYKEIMEERTVDYY